VKLDIKDKEVDKKTTPNDAMPMSLYDSNFIDEHPKAGESGEIFEGKYPATLLLLSYIVCEAFQAGIQSEAASRIVSHPNYFFAIFRAYANSCSGLPTLDRPKLLQTPHEIPELFPFNRTCVYLLMAPECAHLKPKSVVLKGTSPQGPLELEIPISIRAEPDKMIHQLAARKATQELEEGHGWLSSATVDGTDVLVKDKFPHQFFLLQRREAVRLGVEFQVGGRYCSFVAVEADEAEMAAKRKSALEATLKRDVEEEKEEDWEMVPEQQHKMESARMNSSSKYTLPRAQPLLTPYQTLTYLLKQLARHLACSVLKWHRADNSPAKHAVSLHQMRA
jgi:hypothetical protein